MKNTDLIKPLQKRVITQISCGSFHTLALQEDGNLWTWASKSVHMNPDTAEH